MSKGSKDNRTPDFAKRRESFDRIFSKSPVVNCSECENGVLQTKYLPYETTDGKGNPLIIPDVPQEICDKCGSICLKSDASKMIESVRRANGATYRKSKRLK